MSKKEYLVGQIVVDIKQPEKIGIVTAVTHTTVDIMFVSVISRYPEFPDNNRLVSFSKDFSDIIEISDDQQFSEIYATAMVSALHQWFKHRFLPFKNLFFDAWRDLHT